MADLLLGGCSAITLILFAVILLWSRRREELEYIRSLEQALARWEHMYRGLLLDLHDLPPNNDQDGLC